MTDETFHLLSDFRAELPYADEAAVERALARVTRRRRAPRRPAVLAVAFAALVLAAVAVAAVKEGPWWAGGAPPVDPQAVASVARDNMPADVKVADARTVATDGNAALVAVPLDQTGYCLIPAIDGRARFDPPCVYSVTHPERGDSDIAETGLAPTAWLVFGRITDTRAASVDLGPLTVPLARGGFFLAQIPPARWAALDGTANAGAILDENGRVLRRGCVNWGPSPASADPTGGTPAFWLDPAATCKPETVPPPATLDVAHATTIFDVTLTQPYSIWDAGQQIAFEAAPASDGTTCVIAVGPGLPQSVYDRGCSGTRLHDTWAGAPPIQTVLGADLAHADGKAFYAWDVSGTTKPSAGIAKLTLASPTGSADVSYRDGFFFAQLPDTTPGPRIGTVPFPDGPWILTAYDAAGHQVERIDLGALHRLDSPH